MRFEPSCGVHAAAQDSEDGHLREQTRGPGDGVVANSTLCEVVRYRWFLCNGGRWGGGMGYVCTMYGMR